jgi:hypothetical protein
MNVDRLLAKIAAFDLSPYQALEAKLISERDAIEAAQLRGEERSTELYKMRMELRDRAMSGVAAAEALIAGTKIDTLAVDEEAINAEINTLGLAKGELNRRIAELERDRQKNADELVQAITPLIAADVEELEREAAQASARLVEVFSQISIIGEALRGAKAREIDRNLRPIIADLARKNFIPARINLPADLMDGLARSEARQLMRGHASQSPMNLRLLD